MEPDDLICPYRLPQSTHKVLQESYLCQYLGMKSHSKASRVSSAASAAKISLVELSVLEIVIVDLLPKLFSL